MNTVVSLSASDVHPRGFLSGSALGAESRGGAPAVFSWETGEQQQGRIALGLCTADRKFCVSAFPSLKMAFLPPAANQRDLAGSPGYGQWAPPGWLSFRGSGMS